MTKLINHFQRDVDKLIIGYFLGAAPVGYYSKANSLANQPLRAINGLVGPVLYPFMVKMQNQADKVKLLYLKSIQAFSIIYLPSVVSLIIFSKPIVKVLFGVQWLPAAPLVSVFAMKTLYTSFGRVNSIVLQTLGRTDKSFHLQIIFLPIIIASIVIGTQFGLEVVAISFVMASFIQYLTTTIIVSKMINISHIDFINALRSNIVYSGIIGIMMLLVREYFSSFSADINLIIVITSISIGFLFFYGMQVFLPSPVFFNMTEFWNINLERYSFWALKKKFYEQDGGTTQ